MKRSLIEGTKSLVHIAESFFSIPMRKQLVKGILNLDIESAGIDQCGIPFVKLLNGPIFFGLKPSSGDKAVYQYGGKEIQKKIPCDAMSVAQSIVVSYQGGGLKYRGPSKQKHYQVKEGDTVSEMGAFLGFYAMKLAHQVGPSGRVVAIEPIPQNIQLLNRNLRENKISNVAVVPKGVWETNGTTSIKLGTTGGQSNSLIDINQIESGEIDIGVSKLDTIYTTLQIKNLQFVVIQLNGVEVEALRGLQLTSVDNLAIAARYKRPDGSSPEREIVGILSELGYKNVTVEKGGFIFRSSAVPLPTRWSCGRHSPGNDRDFLQRLRDYSW